MLMDLSLYADQALAHSATDDGGTTTVWRAQRGVGRRSLLGTTGKGGQTCVHLLLSLLRVDIQECKHTHTHTHTYTHTGRCEGRGSATHKHRKRRIDQKREGEPETKTDRERETEEDRDMSSPDVRHGGEDSVLEGLWGHPAHWQEAFPSLAVVVRLID